MSTLEFTLDAEEQEFQDEAAKGPTPIPTGWYNVSIIDLDHKEYPDTHDKYAGKEYLQLELRVLDGQYAGRTVKYVRIPLFPRYAPTDKSPDGTATPFIKFFESIGMVKKGKLSVKSWDDLSGKELSARVIVNKYETVDESGNTETRVNNQVQPFAGSYKPKGEAATTDKKEPEGFSL